MRVRLLASPDLSFWFSQKIVQNEGFNPHSVATESEGESTPQQDVLITAIRTCYSEKEPTEIVPREGEKYFGDDQAQFKRLFDMIFDKQHLSVTEHINYTFALEGVSRALLAQLTRHRHISFSVQSQRYVKYDEGFDYVIPPSVIKDKNAEAEYLATIRTLQEAYMDLINAGVPPEDARMVLPNGAATNVVMTLNLRTLFELYAKRQRNKGAQWEISEMVEELRSEVVAEEPWLDEYFERAKEVV